MTDERLIEEARRWPSGVGPIPSAAPANIIKRLADALEDAEKRAETEHYAKNRARNERNEAREALAVFEKAHTPNVRDPEKTHIPAEGVSLSAHTPTDDEREALARRAIRAADEADECGDPVMEAWSDGERFTSDDLRALAAGFRRSVVPEPSEGLCLECGTQCAVPEHDAPGTTCPE